MSRVLYTVASIGAVAWLVFFGGQLRVGAGEPLTGEASVDSGEASGDLDTGAGLDALIEYAVGHSPELRGLEHRARAAEAEGAIGGGLPDPTLRVALAAVPIETRVGPQQAQLTLSQTIPGGGKRGAQRELAEATSETVARIRSTRAAKLAFDVSEAYVDHYFLIRSIELTRANRDILTYLEQTIRKAYESGRAAYADLIRTQVEIGKLENELLGLIDRLRSSEQRLNSLLHRPAGSTLPEPDVPGGSLRLLPEEELRRFLLENAPRLAEYEARLEEDARRIHLAGVDDRVDWGVFVSYLPTGSAIDPALPDSGRDAVYAGVSLNLPVWRKKTDAAEKRAREMRAATLAGRESEADVLADRLERALYRFRNSDREVALYRDTLLPKAEQAFQASETGFRTGSVSVLDLVDSQRLLLQFQLAFENAGCERFRAVAELRMLVGTEVLARAPGDLGAWMGGAS
jgi:outer membrane protein TolC